MVLLDPVPGYAAKTSDVNSGIKVFINVCSDPHVPAPATLDPGAIALRVATGGDWVVPVVVGPNPRKETDKAGNNCVVFDCVLNPQVLLLGVREPEVKLLTIETCIELAEDSSGMVLNRAYKLPKLKAKGIIERFEMPEGGSSQQDLRGSPEPNEQHREFNAQSPLKTSSGIVEGTRSSKNGYALESSELSPMMSILDSTRQSTVDSNSESMPSQGSQTDTAAESKVKPTIVELPQTSPVDEGYWHVWRGPWSGEGTRPTRVLEISGRPAYLRLNGSTLEWPQGRRVLDFLPVKQDTVYARDDDTTYMFCWKYI